MDYNEKEKETIVKGKMITITTLSVIGVVSLFAIIICFIGPKLIDKIFTLRTYRVLKINDENRDEIIDLLKQEKDSIFPEMKYCDSMYKIEFTDLFPDGTDYTIYCKEEKNINFGIDKVGEDVLHSYIKKYGKDKIKFN